MGKKSGANVEVHRPPLVRRRYNEFVPEVKYAESQGASERDLQELEAHLERRQVGTHCRGE